MRLSGCCGKEVWLVAPPLSCKRRCNRGLEVGHGKTKRGIFQKGFPNPKMSLEICACHVTSHVSELFRSKRFVKKKPQKEIQWSHVNEFQREIIE